MVAYNFQKQFVPAIEAGTKIHTMRIVGKRRHAGTGDVLHLYTGLRHVGARKVRELFCTHADVLTIRMPNSISIGEVRGLRLNLERHQYVLSHRDDLDRFARNDGFENWAALTAWIRVTHKPDGQFEPRLIGWASPPPYV